MLMLVALTWNSDIYRCFVQLTVVRGKLSIRHGSQILIRSSYTT